jgi:mannose-6-phosphate isomerase-like protein (cupin superfamily)
MQERRREGSKGVVPLGVTYQFSNASTSPLALLLWQQEQIQEAN